MIQIWRAYFSMGLVQPPTRKLSKFQSPLQFPLQNRWGAQDKMDIHLVNWKEDKFHISTFGACGQHQASLPEPPPTSFVSNRAVTSRRGSVGGLSDRRENLGETPRERFDVTWIPMIPGFFWNLIGKYRKICYEHLLWSALDWSTASKFSGLAGAFWSYRPAKARRTICQSLWHPGLHGLPVPAKGMWECDHHNIEQQMFIGWKQNNKNITKLRIAKSRRPRTQDLLQDFYTLLLPRCFGSDACRWWLFLRRGIRWGRGVAASFARSRLGSWEEFWKHRYPRYKIQIDTVHYWFDEFCAVDKWRFCLKDCKPRCRNLTV